MKQVAGIFLPDSDVYFSTILARDGAFEPGRLDVALKYVKQWRVAVDAGAHVGLRAVELAARFETVVAIEPAPEAYSCLLRNTVLLSNVYPFKFALSDTEGEVAMMASMVRPGNSGALFVTEGRGIPTRTLDSLELQTLDFYKIDCEGHELKVLQGSMNTIFHCSPVVMLEEKHFKDREGRFDIDYRAAGRLLEEWGMKRTEQVKNDVVFTWE